MAPRRNPATPATPAPVMQSPEPQSAAADGTVDAGDSKRKQVSKRDYLDSAGKSVDKIEEATGARYTLLVPGGNKDFDHQFGEAGKFVTMAAIFGFHTKVGNVANTVLNDKDEPGTPDDAGAAIEDFITKAESGVWAERTAGGVGARVDRDALAASIVAVATAEKRESEPKFQYATVRQRLEEDAAYVRSARQVPAVAREYATRTGKQAKSLDDLMK